MLHAAQHRQNEADKEGAKFVHCLRRMKTGTNTSADLRLLQGRTECKLGSMEYRKVAEHEECVHLFSTNREVNKHNLKAVKLHGGDDFTTNPVYSCAAVNTNLAVKALDTQTAGGIPNVLVYRRGAKVMIRRNLVVDAGAVNGSQGYLADVGIVKNSQEKRKDGLPDCVLVALPRSQCTLPSFNNYRWVPHPCEACRNRRRRPGDPPPGDCKDCVVPIAEDGTDLFTLIPVTPISNMRFDGVRVPKGSSRTGVPICLSYAMTIHKCQGLTLLYLCAHMCAAAKFGMDYVLFSRSIALMNLVIDELSCAVTERRLKQIRFKSLSSKTPQVKKLLKLKMAFQHMLKTKSKNNERWLATLLPSQTAPPLTDAHVAPPSPGPSPNSAASADGSSASSSPSAGPSPNPAASLDGPASKDEIDLVLRGLTIMFDPISGLEELQDQNPNAPNAIYVRFTDFAQFLRESPLGLATFPNDDHLADVLSDALRLHPNSEWVCVDNDDCDGCIVKI